MKISKRILSGELVAGISVVLLALSLRPAITGVAPLTERLVASGFSQADVGLLTTIPLICFGTVGFLAARLSALLGLSRTLFAGLLLLSLGIVLRSASITVFFWAMGSFVLGSGIALGNVLLPGFLKARFPERIGLMTAVYSTAINVGTMVGLALAVPLLSLGGWNDSFRFWLYPTLFAAVLWTTQLRFRAGPVKAVTQPFRQLIRQGRVWQLALNFAFLAITFFSSVAWLPAILQDRSFSEEQAAHWVTVMQITGCVASLVAPLVATRLRSQSGLMMGANLLVALCFIGLIILPTSYITWPVVLLGVGLNSAFALVLLALPLRSANPRTTGYLSAFAQSVGYLVSSPAPWATGVLEDLTGSWTLPLSILALAAVASGICAYLVGRPGTISIAAADDV